VSERWRRAHLFRERNGQAKTNPELTLIFFVAN